MRKTIPYLFLLLALALTACGSMTPPAVATPSNPTAIVEQPVATQAQELAAAPTAATAPACRVASDSQSTQELESQFPKVGTTDWSRGPDTAFVHIIEYSDFQ